MRSGGSIPRSSDSRHAASSSGFTKKIRIVSIAIWKT